MKLACGFARPRFRLARRWWIVGGVLIACAAGLMLRFGGMGKAAAERPLAIVVSADTAGWIIPCGCTTNQSGGLARRATYLPVHNNHAFEVTYKRTSDTEVAVTVRFVWHAGSHDAQESSGPRARIEARFEIGYEAPALNENSDEQVLAFAKLNGIFNAWPYWREYLQSMSSRMGLPTMLIPVLTVGSLLTAYLSHEAANAALAAGKKSAEQIASPK